jgi:serine/threonine-protein kinase
VIDVDIADAPAREDEVLVPSGPALIGDHESSLWGKELVEVVVPPFVIARDPVTFGELLGFLADAFARDSASAEAFLPRNDEGEPLFAWDGQHLVPARVRRWSEDPAWLASLPAMGVDRRTALAFAAWKARQTGLAYRLPTEIEWEKAARGVDGRAYPWGDRFDATLCKMRLSRAGLPAPEPVGSFAADVSPYGVRDLAGGVADWVAERGDETRAGGMAITRGGAWSSGATYCHAGARGVVMASERSTRTGFRLARDVGAKG